MIMTGDGSQYKEQADNADIISVFPVLSGKGEGGVATYISNTLKDSAKDPLVIGIDSTISSTGLRIGGAIQTCHHPSKIAKFYKQHFISYVFFYMYIYACIHT